MNFTYTAYEEMLALLKKNNYKICNYKNYQQYKRCVILRHDVDFSLEAALRFAKLEYKNGVQSTYFILLSTSFYNIFDKNSNKIIHDINSMGHDIGLHFDESRYPIENSEHLKYYVKKEISIISNGLDMETRSVSMHRPSKWVLESDVRFDKVINAYNKEFFNDFKYLSDSRMFWREDVHQVIKSNSHVRLHILTHPIWYGNEEGNMPDKLRKFIRVQKDKTYDNLKDNIRDLEDVLSKANI